jgi:hypothetical protein
MNARPRDEAESETRIESHMSRRRDTHKWIVGAHARRELLTASIRLKVISQELSVARIDLFEATNCRNGISECFSGDKRRG